MAISGSVDNTTSLVDGFYVPNMVLTLKNTSKSIKKVIKCRFELFMNQ